MILPGPKPHLVWIDPVPPAPTIFRVRKRQFAFAESGDTKAISQTGFGKNTADFCRIITNLGTRLANIDPQILAVIGMCRAPDRAQDHGLGYQSSGLACQHPQKIKFLAGQFQVYAGFFNPVRGGINLQIRNLDDDVCASPAVCSRNSMRRRASNSCIPNGFTTQSCAPASSAATLSASSAPTPKAPEPAPVTIPGWRAAR